MGKNVKRLFAEFQPKHYILELEPDREAKTFTGMVIISGNKVYRPNERLTFHQSGLTVTSAHIIRHDKKGDEEITVDRINHHGAFDEVRLHAKTKLYPGNYTVRLHFKGKITRPMNGMYPCFFEEDGHEKQLIATQFESHHAREVFPCIDEPEAKATFDLTLTTPAGETVLANTPVKHQETKEGRTKTTFLTTPHMSTYLLAFVYGELGFKEAKTRDGVLVRTYATPHNVQFTDFALDVAVRTLEFYNDYFGIDYPLPKCDMIALPDFASGAMENWGCITYREQCMLVDPANSTLANRQYVAMVVAHELAHQWFGNLVTMRWWTDLWLNEGFASWIEYLAVDHLFPEWQMWTQFAVDEQQRAFKLDALEHTHPIEVPVHHPDEIRTIFDTISYSKGASIINMLHEYLGHDAFRDG
jgi:puromycin-sensitive aminopeptidase